MVLLTVVIFHCLTLNFPPTKEVPILTDSVILSLPGINKTDLVIIFVVPVNILAVDEPAGLLGQLRTFYLSILVISELWFLGSKRRS